VAPDTNNSTQGEQADAGRSTRRERRSSKGRPAPAEVAAEASAIYPDTFDTPPTPEEIAAEAYAIYQSRGGEHGRHDDDWFEAERRISDRRRQQGG
jgi:Protein of unknown function (DUF2934)